MKGGTIAVIMGVLLFSAGDGRGVSSPSPGAAADRSDRIEVPVSLDQAAWLAGHWEGEGMGGSNEVIWSPPRAGSMMGVFRHIEGDTVRFYEMLVLRERAGRLVLSLKHFDPELRGWEEREESVEFPLLRASADSLVFDGLTYTREGPDHLVAEVMVQAGGEEARPVTFRYRRATR